MNRWLTAITTRYPEIKIIEVANEVFTPGTGPNSFWTTNAADLSELSDWVLDWRKNTGWSGKIWSPSIP
jgi:hypothetical protein